MIAFECMYLFINEWKKHFESCSLPSMNKLLLVMLLLLLCTLICNLSTIQNPGILCFIDIFPSLCHSFLQRSPACWRLSLLIWVGMHWTSGRGSPVSACQSDWCSSEVLCAGLMWCSCVLGQLKVNNPELMEQAVTALQNLAQQCSDPSAVQDLVKHLFGILGGQWMLSGLQQPWNFQMTTSVT